MTGRPDDMPAVARQVADLLEQLTRRVVTHELVPTYRGVRRGPDRTVTVLDWRTHTTTAPGLIEQLEAAAVPGGSPGWDDDGALAAYVTAGRAEPPEPVTDAWHAAQDTRAALDALAESVGVARPGELVAAAAADPDGVGEPVAAALRRLVTRARIAAGYDAPITALRDVVCPECGGRLLVRADASSAVWCGGRQEDDGTRTDPCGATWPRGAWVDLLEAVTRDHPETGASGEMSAAQDPPRGMLACEPTPADTPDVLAGLTDRR